jgi:hypothetical protein
VTAGSYRRPALSGTALLSPEFEPLPRVVYPLPYESDALPGSFFGKPFANRRMNRMIGSERSPRGNLRCWR